MLIKEYLNGILSIYNNWCREVRKHPCWVNFPHEWNLVSMLNNLLEFELKLLKFHITSDLEIVAQWIVPVKHASQITGLPGKKTLHLWSSGIEGNGLRECNFKTWKCYVKSIDVLGTIHFSDISGWDLFYSVSSGCWILLNQWKI